MYDVSLKQKEELVNKMLLARQRVSVVTSHGVYTNLYKSSTAITVTIIVGGTLSPHCNAKHPHFIPLKPTTTTMLKGGSDNCTLPHAYMTLGFHMGISAIEWGYLRNSHSLNPPPQQGFHTRFHFAI